MIYLDHNASTPVRPEVCAAMAAALAEHHANPSSLHRDGQKARGVIERARAQVAALLGAASEDVVFVSGGTEGDHEALIGAAWALESRGRRVAISTLEHHAVHGAADVLTRLGFAIEHLAASPAGFVDPRGVDALPADTTVISVMLANNETGVIQPVADVCARAAARGMRVHCDAVQAAGKVPIDMCSLGADYVVISAHKLGGPKGVGALVRRPGAPLEPLLRGSGHESHLRAGTENLPGIVGFGLAAELSARDLVAERTRLMALRSRFEAGLRALVPDLVIHGVSAPRLPNTVNASFPGARSDHLLMALDARGVAVSAGAACSSGAVEPSPVLIAMGVEFELATCALRFSFGHTTTADEIERALEAIGASIPAARAAAGSLS